MVENVDLSMVEASSVTVLDTDSGGLSLEASLA